MSKSDWMIPAALILLSLVPAIAGTIRVTEVAGNAPTTPENARFMAAPLPVLIHIPAAIVYSLLGAFQFSPGYRRRHRRWHKAVGRMLVPCAFLVAFSGVWMAQFYAWPPGDGRIVYIERLIVGWAMIGSIVFAIDAIRRRDFISHGAWMTRAYALALGAGTQVLTHIPWFLLVDGKPGGMPRAVMMGAGWALNIVVAEWIIRRKAPHRKPIMVTA